MSVIIDQINKAVRRLNFDIADRISELQDKPPGETSSGAQKKQRLDFLTRSLGDKQNAVITLERVLIGNELQPVNYLERGMIAARPVARIEIRKPDGGMYGWGSGFLIAPGVLITNNHVLPEDQWALHSQAHFSFEADINDELVGPLRFSLEPERLFYTSRDLDFTVVAVSPHSDDGDRPLADFGYLPLIDTAGKSMEGEWLTIIQHPAGERKQLCVRENRLLNRTDEVLWYSTDTVGGSSGSPVFNNDWFVVALHHSGVPEMKDGKIQTVDGRDFDPDRMDESAIKWQANEGIRASRITGHLKMNLPEHPLLQPLFSATPASARIGSRPAAPLQTGESPGSAAGTIPVRKDTPMAQDNVQTVRIPIEITLKISSPFEITASSSPAGAMPGSGALVNDFEASTERMAKNEAPFDSDYGSRKGYDPDFIGGGSPSFRIALPVLSPALGQEATKLIGSNDYELKYHNYSVVMHRKRRFAIYSAANVSFADRYAMNRPGDVWRIDPRIPREAQVGEYYYISNNFDRGHLTRREDLEYGSTPRFALASAGDTNHFTNCTPQHRRFNQNRQIWQGIEFHILEDSVLNGNFNAQIFTGPIFDDSDPDYRNIQYPLQYWKIVAAKNSAGKLFATAFLASQKEVINQFGVEAAAALPVGPFKNFQVKISEIERLTGLKFVCGAKKASLSKCDPLENVKPRRQRILSAAEAASAVQLPHGYIELRNLDDIVF